MADRFGRMPVPPEMNTFKAEVRGDQHFVFGPQPQHRTVVSDAGEEGTIPAPRASLERHSTDVGDESFFWQRHGQRNHSPKGSAAGLGHESGHAPSPPGEPS
jgi:hypothetical protein